MSETDTRTATQRIEDLERVVASMYQATGKLILAVEDLTKKTDDMVLIKEALKLLNRKTEAIIQTATPESGITDASVSAVLIKINTADLIAQTAGYVSAGFLSASDTIAADSFVACEEVNSEGTVVNPRIQFRLDSQPQATQDALIGKKAGDSVSFGENKFGVKVLEVYKLQTPPTPQTAEAAAAAPATEAPAPAPEATQAPEAAATDATPAPAAETAAPAATTAPTGPSNEALAAPTESPVTEFVPSQPGTMTVAS
ncbi:MAG TPA: hypothetical protein VIJ14_01290 [Rhabdochlamydiaceae bacterium]